MEDYLYVDYKANMLFVSKDPLELDAPSLYVEEIQGYQATVIKSY